MFWQRVIAKVSQRAPSNLSAGLMHVDGGYREGARALSSADPELVRGVTCTSHDRPLNAAPPQAAVATPRRTDAVAPHGLHSDDGGLQRAVGCIRRRAERAHFDPHAHCSYMDLTTFRCSKSRFHRGLHERWQALADEHRPEAAPGG
jgi:hypothetical protein